MLIMKDSCIDYFAPQWLILEEDRNIRHNKCLVTDKYSDEEDIEGEVLDNYMLKNIITDNIINIVKVFYYGIDFNEFNPQSTHNIVPSIGYFFLEDIKVLDEKVNYLADDSSFAANIIEDSIYNNLFYENT